MIYKIVIKRFLDFFAALLGIFILCPIFFIITIVLFIDFRGNPFFKQDRPGKNGKVFKIIKFKTMNDKKDKSGNFLSDSQRITIIGQLIRRTSLDEIPQLINIIKGDMSLVGPRPLRTFYLPYYTEYENSRHAVRPGITGLAQVSGRNYLTWEERFDLDVYYVRNLSLLLDLKILVKTFKKVITGKDVAKNPDDFVENFDVYRKRQRANGVLPKAP